MRICGVIAEYDPFHRGHAYHLAKARAKTEADAVVCVLSGSFTQRGLPALFPPQARAEMALRCGADIVVQLPYAFAVREAEYFARGGVGILSALGCTHLAFGSETEDLPLLTAAARLLEAPDDAFQALLRAGLDRGLSHAAATGSALSQQLAVPPSVFQSPNAALALSYLRAMQRLRSPMEPAVILRRSDYHADEPAPLPSATAMRQALLRGDWQSLRAGIPAAAWPVLEKAVCASIFCPPDSLDSVLRHRLLSMPPEELAALPGVAEGLEQRILSAARQGTSREKMLALIKTRRYTQGRISRIFCHALMGVSAADFPAAPACARLLGFRESARPLLRQMQKGPLPLFSRPARAAADWALDLRADALWAIGAGRSIGETYRQSPVILSDASLIL